MMARTLTYILLPLLFSLSAFAVETPESCEGIDLSAYMHAGAPQDAAPEKIYKFKEMRDQILNSLNDGKKSACLVDFYQQGLNEEGEYWGGRLAQAGCEVSSKGEITGSCPEAGEARKSVTYVSSLDRELRSKLQDKIEAAREARAPAAATADAPPAACPAPVVRTSAQDTRDAFCCGTKNDAGGMIRAVETHMNYNTCIGKIRPTNESFLSGGGIASCLGNAIKGAAEMIWDSITSILKLPGELWGARSQIWALLTQPEARAKFASQLMNALKSFFTDRVAAFGCYNSYEKAQYVCKLGGQIIAMCALPETFGAFLGLASKPAMLAAKSIGNILSATGKGKALLSGMARASSAASRGVTAVGSKARAAGAAVNRATGGRAGALAERAGSALGKVNNVRKIIGRPLSLAAEKLALRIENSSSFQRLFVSGFKAEQRAMVAAKVAQAERPPVAQQAAPAAQAEVQATAQAAEVPAATQAAEVRATAQAADEVVPAPRASEPAPAPAATAEAPPPGAAPAPPVPAEPAFNPYEAPEVALARARSAASRAPQPSTTAAAPPRAAAGVTAEMPAVRVAPVNGGGVSRTAGLSPEGRATVTVAKPDYAAPTTTIRTAAGEALPARTTGTIVPKPVEAVPAPPPGKIKSFVNKVLGRDTAPAGAANVAVAAKPPGKIKTFINKILGREPASAGLPAKVPNGPEYRKIEESFFPEGNNHFLKMDRGTPEAATAANADVVKALNDWPTETPNPKRLSGFDDGQIEDLYRKVKSDNNTMCSLKNYDPKGNIGFCFGRATRAHIEALKAGISKDQVRKIWAVGSLQNGSTSWGWHVSTIVRNKAGQWIAIDPIFGYPMPVEQWYATMKTMDVGGNMRLLSSRAERFATSPGKYTPRTFSSPFYNEYFPDMLDWSPETRARRAAEAAGTYVPKPATIPLPKRKPAAPASP